MLSSKNLEKYLWIIAVFFMTGLLIGSFIISKDLKELFYLILFYTSIIKIRLFEK